MRKLYLAGPQVFLEDPEPYYKLKQELCTQYGYEGVAPFDSNTDYNYRPTIEKGLLYSFNNEKLMNSCDIMTADITPFRCVSADIGTGFEIGFMRALKKRIMCYSNTKIDFHTRSTSVHSAEYKDVDIHGMRFENFGMVDNLMIHGSVIYSGGEAPAGELYTYLGVFEKMLQHMQKSGY